MSKAAEPMILVLYAVAIYIALPTAMIWGWVRSARRAGRSSLRIHARCCEAGPRP